MVSSDENLRIYAPRLHQHVLYTYLFSTCTHTHTSQSCSFAPRYCGFYEGSGTANSDPTCRAFWAGMKAHIKLQDLHFTPVFVNMAVVNWYANLPGHFPSWGSSDAVTVSYSEGKVTNVTIHQPNAVAPYAFCEIAYTTLRQNFDQAGRGQCVPTAVLAALAAASPAGAIKLGLEMFWTGKPALADIDHVDPECTYIHHDMPPGIIPFKVGQPGALETGALKVACFGNQADCTAARGSPFTNAGFQGMWSIFMTATNGLRKSGDCKEENRNAWVTYPGMDEKHFRSVHDTMPAKAAAWQIEMAFGQSPEFEELLDLIKNLFFFFFCDHVSIQTQNDLQLLLFSQENMCVIHISGCLPIRSRPVTPWIGFVTLKMARLFTWPPAWLRQSRMIRARALECARTIRGRWKEPNSVAAVIKGSTMIQTIRSTWTSAIMIIRLCRCGLGQGASMCIAMQCCSGESCQMAVHAPRNGQGHQISLQEFWFQQSVATFPYFRDER